MKKDEKVIKRHDSASPEGAAVAVELAKTAQTGLEMLGREASRNGHALSLFIEVVGQAAAVIDEMAEGWARTPDGPKQSEHLRQWVREIAARRPDWPGVIGAHPAALADAERRLRELGLGKRHRYAKVFGVPTGPKRARMDSPAQAISIDCRDAVVRLIRQAADKAAGGEDLTPEEAEAHALPELAKGEGFDRWFALGWVCYLESGGAETPQWKALAQGYRPERWAKPPTLEAWMRDQVKKASAWWCS